ncbi:hemolysin family protein [Paraburkholderia sp. DHOC27]|uniref:hemolysin family protein n=1 Tax=Paraburkholderia sp. DHOC27 TaxID=2303330 RepID=UPI000E3D62B8|nr:hemolysin family protein [Paraburkholderia sp. DHOC27]RFU44298.1 HlyC/CorC family transporter [Paraburkholderia sp. DHOC27]
MLSIQILLFLFFVALTAFFNVAEMALVAARPARLEALSSRHWSNAKLAASLKQEPGAFLSAVQCGITATSILAGTFCVNAFIASITSSLTAIPGAAPYASSAGTLIAVVIATYLTLVFGELAPKRIALSAPEQCAAILARPLQWTITLGRPFILLLGWSNDLLLRALHIRERTDDMTTGEEIRSVIMGALRSGTIQAAERSMLESILQLRVRTARTIMTPRRMLEWVDGAMSDEEIRKRIADSPCSKLIVTQGRDVDHPLGVAAKKEILRTVMSGGDLNLETHCQPPVFVAENSPILGLLGSLKRARAQMLFVVDEFGTVVGIVTLTDVLEAVAGDVPEPERQRGGGSQIRKQSDGSYLASGQLPADDLAEYLGIEDPTPPTYKTVAGLVLAHLKHLPQEGERLTIANWTIEVVQADARSIQQLRLIPPSGNQKSGKADV